MNTEKPSLMFGKSTSPNIANRICRILEVGEGKPPFNYLGIPSFHGKVRRRHLRVIHDNILSKFATWKGNTLSLMGRMALVRSVIYGSLMHSFTIYRWPISLLKEMEKGIRNFIWTGNVLNKSRTLVSWSKCCKSREEGGLGIRKLKPLNEAMLAKFTFKIIAEKGLVQDFLRTRFTHNGKVWNCPTSSSIWLSLKSSFKDVYSCCQWIPGTSSSLGFWTDNWLGYRIVDQIHMSQGNPRHLKGLIKDFRRNGSWDIPMPHLIDQNTLSDIRNSKFGNDDTFVCKLSNHGKANVDCFYKWFAGTSCRKEWGKLIWNNFVTPSRSFELWRFLHHRTPVDEMFKTQGVQLVSQCPFCLRNSETLNHLFFECSFAAGIWQYL